VAALLALASCATVPLRQPAEWLGVLPGDATLYASLSVSGSADLIRSSLKDAGPGFQDVSTVVDMSKRLVCSVTLARGEPARFSAVALGSYPPGIIGMRLAGNKEWKKVTSPAGSWWEWSKAGLQMGIPSRGLILASNGDVERMLGRWSSPPPMRVPPDAADDMRTADLVIYMPELPGGIPEGAERADVHLPIQEVWLKGVRAAGGFDISGTANTGSEREAKVVTLALRLGIVAWMRSEKIADAAARLKSITVSANGVQVKLAGLKLADAEIVPLFLSLVKGLAPGAGEPASGESATGEPSAGQPAAGDSGDATPPSESPSPATGTTEGPAG
jgi:hypothetical protein